ncbi:Zn-ribbon domain-containing protein [Halococcoides cellulosivorans]|uniref:Zn-ribbon containing protein n=1 Tax=Halococcoides cellulosivorans TaxID=1679096 RepID=A0A2R4WYH5_9EURY|nr:Zn-ribbon containing protein [Halococcoides cellulosivorans]AWB26594.1 hypothetical protein HARCEL1_02140 [Halococcoides cellulosivorans]
MPHLCTACGRSFADGSSEMLTGCPDCGGSTFQYDPEGTDGPVATAGIESSDEAPTGDAGGDGTDEQATASTGATASPSQPASTSSAGAGAREPEPTPEHEESATERENAAQAQARAELADPPAYESSDEPTASPDRETVREALTDQFESIRVIDRGQYELNLVELFNRDEYIVRLGEEGRYHIQMPESRR